jgi:hypothetical protein
MNEKPSPLVGKFLDKLAGKTNMNLNEGYEEEYQPKMQTGSLETEIAELKEQVMLMMEMIERLQGKTIISEGSGDKVDILIAGHHFTGTMKAVKK